jgi:SAM-dependent methyltransferase
MTDYEQYYAHLQSINRFGRFYKRYVASPVLHYQASLFGSKFAEIGCGVGSGILGAYPQHVTGFEINPMAVDYCKTINLQAHQITVDKRYPALDGEFDACVLDNVLEHIAKPDFVMQECARITRLNGGLIIAVPGGKGYRSDPDHKVFYGEKELQQLHPSWQLTNMFSIPFFVRNKMLSELMPQYCLLAVYQKRNA